MSSFSDYLEAAALNHFFRAVSTTAPAAVYAGLTTGATDATAGTEVTGNGYARKAITFGAPTTVATGKQVANSAQVMFDQATPAGWSYDSVVIYDAATAGNPLAYKVVGSKTVTALDRAFFEVAAITVDLT